MGVRTGYPCLSSLALFPRHRRPRLPFHLLSNRSNPQLLPCPQQRAAWERTPTKHCITLCSTANRLDLSRPVNSAQCGRTARLMHKRNTAQLEGRVGDLLSISARCWNQCQYSPRRFHRRLRPLIPHLLDSRSRAQNYSVLSCS